MLIGCHHVVVTLWRGDVERKGPDNGGFGRIDSTRTSAAFRRRVGVRGDGRGGVFVRDG